MDKEQRDELFTKMQGLDDEEKNRILTRVFGYVESTQDEEKTFDPEHFFKIVESFVKKGQTNS
ncbi:hypothetical protein [Aquibacillus rhizosphaerae]|uniref:Uncharacterized protein n=1 Tax=Aquibacillus rhizosphaerae TaxID=3051431 RepID=A0ABT7LA98_9BACI|nr:hypothetical protein [Aquibacillus sp. LR5S19]MDL4842802.1 hypothetical protein [Aquibacillus sp. LR5S19]